MAEREVARLILKEKDILVLYLPLAYFRERQAIISIYQQIKERLLDAGKKNKVLMVPEDVKLGVIGEEEVKEHVSNIDLWHLFDEEGETND
jgi:hypothetical protein